MTGLPIHSFDSRIMLWVAAHRTGGATHVARSVMYVGTTPWCLLVGGVVALGVVVRLRAYRPAVAGIVAVVAAEVVARVLKDAFGRARPPTRLALVYVDPPSFPSTHAALTSALAVTVLVAVAWPSVRMARFASVLLLAIVVFVGVCMVYVGAHWPTDILAGWVLGTAIGGCCGWLARRWRPFRSGPGRQSPGVA